MDNTDNKSEGENTLFDINPTDKENDLLQPIKDENNMDVDIDVANDRQSIDESASPLSNKRSRTQRQADDESGDEVQTIGETTDLPLTKKPKRVKNVGGNRTRKIKSKKLHLKKTRRKIHPKKRTSSTIKHNKLKHKQKRNTRRKR